MEDYNDEEKMMSINITKGIRIVLQKKFYRSYYFTRK